MLLIMAPMPSFPRTCLSTSHSLVLPIADGARSLRAYSKFDRVKDDAFGQGGLP